jgi:hypothetical protein
MFGRHGFGFGIHGPSYLPHRLGLLATCRQLHFETSFLPFVLNVFGFGGLDVFELQLLRFLPPQLQAISQTTLQCDWRTSTTLRDFIDLIEVHRHHELSDVLPNVHHIDIYLLSYPEELKPEESFKREEHRAACEIVVGWMKGTSEKTEVKVLEMSTCRRYTTRKLTEADGRLGTAG